MKQFHLNLNPPHLPTDWPGADRFQQDNSTGKSWISQYWILLNTYFIWSTYSTLLSRSRGQRQHEFSCLRLRCSCCFCQQHFLSTVGQFTFIRCWQTWPGLTIANLLLESVRKHWEILSFLSWARYWLESSWQNNIDQHTNRKPCLKNYETGEFDLL